jgi:hypothetical protein
LKQSLILLFKLIVVSADHLSEVKLPHRSHSSPTSEFTIVTRGSKRRRNGGKKGAATDSTASFVFAGHDHEGDSNLNELARLIATLKDTITQQSSIIETVRADLTAVKSEQQDLKNQNAQLQEEIRSLQTQLSAYSASIPTPRSWASVAASPSGSGSGSIVIFSSDPSAGRDPVSNFRIFEGVDESTRPSQRLDRFDVDVKAEPGIAAVKLDLGRYARSRTRRARLLVSAIRPTILAVTLI